MWNWNLNFHLSQVKDSAYLMVLAQLQKHTADEKQIRNPNFFVFCFLFFPSAVKMCVAGGAGLSLWVNQALPEVYVQMEMIPASDEAVRTRYWNLEKLFAVLFI